MIVSFCLWCLALHTIGIVVSTMLRHIQATTLLQFCLPDVAMLPSFRSYLRWFVDDAIRTATNRFLCFLGCFIRGCPRAISTLLPVFLLRTLVLCCATD